MSGPQWLVPDWDAPWRFESLRRAGGSVSADRAQAGTVEVTGSVLSRPRPAAIAIHGPEGADHGQDEQHVGVADPGKGVPQRIGHKEEHGKDGGPGGIPCFRPKEE